MNYFWLSLQIIQITSCYSLLNSYQHLMEPIQLPPPYYENSNEIQLPPPYIDNGQNILPAPYLSGIQLQPSKGSDLELQLPAAFTDINQLPPPYIDSEQQHIKLPPPYVDPSQLKIKLPPPIPSIDESDSSDLTYF